jgi:CHAD domain-containing protein
VLRLIRDSLGKKNYEQEDNAYRDAARTLSSVRDSAALLEILGKLTKHFSDQLSRDAFVDVVTPLQKSKRNRQQDQKKAMTDAAKALRRARKRVSGWPQVGHSESLNLGLKRVFKKGRRSFATAYAQPSVETFHEWRKQVKHLLYQTRVLKPLWQTMMKALTTELKTLGGYLSDDHDLAILRDKVAKQN